MSSAAGNNDGEADRNTVFLSTSLDTHLVTTVSGSDTVSDFKKKIMLEHCQCFPAIGNIIVHSLKVKRRGVFFHLLDSIPVKSAFGATKKNWFVSVDASRLEQDSDINHFDELHARDRVALPWITHNRSINSHDNHELLLIQPKTIPSVNQILSNVNSDSCEDVLKNIEEDRSSDDKQLAIYKEITSKKRARDVSNKTLLKDPSQCEPPLKKKRKTEKVKSNVKASEENIVLTHDFDKEKGKGVSMNNENAFQHISENKELIGENTRINNDEKRSDLDKVAPVVPSVLEGVGRETIADVAIVVEKNIQHGMFEKEKQNEHVQKAVMENVIPSSMRTSDCIRDATELTVADPLNGGSKHCSKPKAAEKEVSSASLIKKLHDINKDAIDSLQQDVGFNSQDSHRDLIDKLMEDREVSLNQRPEVKLPEKRKKVKKSTAKNKIETPVMHANDNLVGDISSTVLAPVVDEKNKVLETTFLENFKKNDEMIVKEMEVTEPTKSYENRVHVETMEEKSKNNLKDVVGSRKKKKVVEKTALKKDKSVVKQNEKHSSQVHVDCVGNDNVSMNNDVELLMTEKHLSQVHVEDINDKSEKQNEKKVDAVKKEKRKKKTKKSASRNEDESITKQHVNGDNVKEHDISLPHIYEELAGKEKNNKSSPTGPQDRLNEDQSTKVELESKKSQSIDHNDNLEDTSKNVTVSEIPKVNNKVDVTKDGSHGMNSLGHFAPGHQLNKTASVDNGKETKKPKKKKKDDSKNDDGIQSLKITRNEGLVEKVKNSKSSLTGTQDRLSKRQSTEVELKSEKSQSIDHHHHLEDASKNVTVSEVSKVNNKVGITDDGSHEINFLDYFAPGQQPNKIASINNGKVLKKLKKKTKDGSRNDGEIQSKKIISKNENNKVVTESNIRNIDNIKKPGTTKNIDYESSSSSESFGRSFHNQKSNKQQSVMGSVKKVVPVVNSLLTTPGKIFADDDSDGSSADDNTTANSDSCTRTPSRTSTSSGESASSIDSRRNGTYAMKRVEGGGKKSKTEQNKLKTPSMTCLLRSSSRFKKAKFNASQGMEDTESQPVDFVPDSQPIS